jgi:DNA-binding NarL/FixJ family response regulator
MPPLRVLIADDHQPFAETLGLTFDFDERVEVAGSARNGKEAVRLALELQPDAVMMDLGAGARRHSRNAVAATPAPRVPGGRPDRFPLPRGRPPGPAPPALPAS